MSGWDRLHHGRESVCSSFHTRIQTSYKDFLRKAAVSKGRLGGSLRLAALAVGLVLWAKYSFSGGNTLTAVQSVLQKPAQTVLASDVSLESLLT